MFSFMNPVVCILLWIFYGGLLLFITVWVVIIMAWVVHILKTIADIKRNTREQLTLYNNTEKIKELTVQLWKFHVLLVISVCEMIALINGALTVSMNKVHYLYSSDLTTDIVLSYLHDVLYIICLYIILTVLNLLNLLTKYLLGVYNWSEYKPDRIKRELRYILIETVVIGLLAAVWVVATPLGLILLLRAVIAFLKHVKLSKELYEALKGISLEYKRQNNSEGEYQFRISKQNEKNYRWFARWIMIGLSFWLTAVAVSLSGVILNQVKLVLIPFHKDFTIFNEITSHRIYLFLITDIFIIVGGVVLFPIHVYYTIKHLTTNRCTFRIACLTKKRMTNRRSDLSAPLI